MDPGTVLLIILLVIIVVVLGVMITAGILISRGVIGLVRLSKPSVEKARRSALKVRVQTGTGPVRDLLELRLQLQESLEATVRSLTVAKNAQQYTGNLEYIVQTLTQAGSVVERQLLVAQKDPDPGIQRVYAQTLGVQVHQITQTAGGVRSALASAAQPMTDVDLADLTRKLDIEAQMLQKWSATYTELGND